MIVYSKKIVRFVREIKFLIREILMNEAGFHVLGDRFYDPEGRFSYPIKVVMYNTKTMLGYFDPNFYEIGMHECLMYAHQKQVHEIVRHELAHYLTFINYGASVQAHGNEFRTVCWALGWGEGVYRATCCLEGEVDLSGGEESSVLRKVKKLMALATSSNSYEAEQAMIKSQQLLLKHHIESEYIYAEDEEKIFLKRILKQKRENAKMRAIAQILQTFFVSVVYNRGGDHTYLEILGNSTNIEIAEYVADVLQNELERLWTQAKQEANLKGMVAKNSFFFGIAKGYCNKIQSLKKEYGKEAMHTLMVIEKQLVDGKAMAYSRLSSKRGQGSYCPESSALGEQMGRQLNINPAVDKSSGHAQLAIPLQ